MPKAPRNRTIALTDEERDKYRRQLLTITDVVPLVEIQNRVINQDIFEVIDLLPSSFVDLLFLDPPYNLTKIFNTRAFKQMSVEQYMAWLESWLPKTLRLLKPTASVYICGDWRSSSAIQRVCEKYFIIQNRITFERERGAESEEQEEIASCLCSLPSALCSLPFATTFHTNDCL